MEVKMSSSSSSSFQVPSSSSNHSVAGIFWKTRLLQVVCVTFILITRLTEADLRWLGLAGIEVGDGSFRKDADCRDLSGVLSLKQQHLCQRNAELMPGIKYGANLAIDECQHQQKKRRWNCSVVAPSSFQKSTLNEETREGAFVQALASAGLSFAITRTCNSGDLDRCGCDKTVSGRSSRGFHWAGCSDNVAFGVAFARTFINAGEMTRGKRDGGTLVSQHNTNIGYRTVSDNTKVRCKCHGVSGSCELKTCWKTLPHFRHVGQILRDKFDAAVEVSFVRLGSSVTHLVPKNLPAAIHRSYSPTDLVYLEASPDFCDPDEQMGSSGTTGRRCNRTSTGTDGCGVLCCGRGFAVSRRTVVEKCHCKFNWCCQVKCQRCRKTAEEQHCL